MPEIPAATRRRLLGVLFTASGLTRTGFIAAITVASLVAEDLTGSAGFAGLPAALTTVGVALGTAPFAALMARRGRRLGIALGHATAVAGAGVAAFGVATGSFAPFVAGMFLFGLGNAGDRLSRYAAADVMPPDRRSFAIGVVVWAGTVGSVAGPALLAPAERLAESIGLEGLAGPSLLAAGTLGMAAILVFSLLRPDPLDLAPAPTTARAHRLREALPALRRPSVAFGVVALVIGQVVMVLIMTMTPIHIRRSGDSLGIVGLVIGAHTLGMFAVSPLTGLLSDRFGRIRVVLAGQAVLAASSLLAMGAAGDETVLLVLALFLLGLGWNFGFIAASAFITEQVAADRRVALQGVADTLAWSSGAVASFSSGVILEASSYAALCIMGAALVLVPLALAVRHRKALRGVAQAKAL